MTNEWNKKFTRREMLKTVFAGSAATLLGLRLSSFGEVEKKDPFPGGRFLGLIEFVGEGLVPMGVPMGTGLDGRQYTDLSDVSRDHLAIPNEEFYLRTRASEFLDDRKPWTIRIAGPGKQAAQIGTAALRKMARPTGLHLMECSGNVRLGHFGMLSVADWAGAPISEILALGRIDKAASRVLISGFDRYPIASITSEPGASWIFTVDELNSAKAFLATEMNGASLTKDHGAPVRMVVPGWYGCVCIKWVNEISLVPEDSPSTSQMREFAGRTMQQGVPELAKDYRAALIEQAAMPIRVEKWLVEQKTQYRVCGIAWGGSRPVRGMEIRFNAGEDFVPLDNFEQAVNDPWTFWMHPWAPRAPGMYSIQLRVKDRSVPARRLEAGYYVRSVEIVEV